MERARWNRIEEVLEAALDRDPGERRSFLDAECGSDEELRREVESLLAQEPNPALSCHPAIARIDLPELLTGQRVSHYRIEQRIGAGGMGEVYQARDDLLQRVVALKVFPAELAGDPDRVRRFEQEALSASRLNHPNIITIFEILDSGGTRFIATERIEGQTLRELLAGGRLKIDQALDIAIQIAAALKAAHTAWIIHRDIKPENLMVRGDGLVKVLDFGIAKLSGEPEPVSAGQPVAQSGNLTIPGSIVGTANYMSPEQARGEQLDGRTDLYSLGMVFYEMVTGERLTAANSPQRARLDHVPRELERIIRKLLRPNRDERYSSAGDLLDDLHQTKRRMESRTARRMVGLGVLAVLVAVAVAAIAAFLSINEQWEERVLRDGHTAAARQAVFSPDGSLVVSCAEDGQVIVWNFARRERVATLPVHAHKVAYAPNGKWLATGGFDGTVTIWDAARWTPTQRLRVASSETTALNFSRDSMLLVASAGDVQKAWRTANWELARQWQGYGTSHGTMIVAGRGDHVLVSAYHMTALDLDGRSLRIGDATLGINWMMLSPDQKTLAAIDTFGVVRFNRVIVPGDLHRIEELSAHTGHQDHGRGIAYSPDGKLVASAADDVVLWDAATRDKLARFEYPSVVWSVVFSPDGRWLLSTHGDGAVVVWDVAERVRTASFNEHSGGVRAVAFSRDGKRVASGSEDRAVVIWDPETGRKQAVLTGHKTRVMGVAFTDRPNELATVDQSSVFHLWDVEKRRPHASFRAHQSLSAYCLAASADGRHLATTTFLWDRAGMAMKNLVPETDGQVYGMDFSDDGRRIAAASTSGTILIWDVATRRLLARGRVPRTKQVAVSFSPDGKLLASGEDEGTIRLWSVEPLREIAILGRHGARVKAVAFSPDGRKVATAGDDKMIALWDVRRRKLHSRVGTHASPVYALAFSPDGKRLVSGEHDRSVRVYTLKRTLWGIELD